MIVVLKKSNDNDGHLSELIKIFFKPIESQQHHSMNVYDPSNGTRAYEITRK